MDFHFEKATFSLPHPRLFCVCARKKRGPKNGISGSGSLLQFYRVTTKGLTQEMEGAISCLSC